MTAHSRPDRVTTTSPDGTRVTGGPFDEDALDDADRSSPVDDLDPDNRLPSDNDLEGEHENLMVAAEDPLDEPAESDA